jgi:ElaA protein
LKFTFKHFDQLTLEELYWLLQLRSEVFVVEQNCVYQDIDDKDRQGFHLLGFIENQLVAYARILPKGISYIDYCSIGRVCTKKTYRQLGSGKKLMQQTILHCRELYPNTKIKISAQSYLLKFYTELGFEAIGEEYLEDDIPHRAMVFSHR